MSKHPLADTPFGRAVMALYQQRLRPPPPRPDMRCIGCDRAPATDFPRPSLCPSCAGRFAMVVGDAAQIDGRMLASAKAALATRRRAWRIPSLLVLAFHGGEDLLKFDAGQLAAGWALDPTTTVRACKDLSWTTRLVWRRWIDGVKLSHTQHIRFLATKPRRHGKRRRA